MKKIELGQAMTILANLGVIAGIVLLAVELAQNTEAIRSQTLHSVQTEFREVFQFPESYLASVDKEPSEYTLSDHMDRRSFFMRAMRIFENQWFQYSLGYLDEMFFDAYQQQLRVLLSVEYNAALWDIRKDLGFFHPEFVTYVEGFLVEHPPFADGEANIQAN